MHQYLNYIDILGNYILGFQAAGYLNNNFAFKWIQYFNKYSAIYQQSTYYLLLFNGYSSHLIIEFAKYYKQKNIHLFTILAYTSHFL